jgi:uncharacterized protein (UPF0332 family)
MTQPPGSSGATGLRPERLLDHARQLARRGTDTASPRTVHARRAVSAAYYAVFHRVTINLARKASPGLPESMGWALCRTFSHTKIMEVTDLLVRRPDELRKSTPARATLTADLVDLALDGRGMAPFAHGFGPLQRARHSADYDHIAVIDRPTAAEWVRSAETLVEIVDDVYPEPAWQAFTTLILLKSTLAHRA